MPSTSRRAALRRRPASGAVAILVALAMTTLLGMAGLAVDSARLFINKTELQTAADACALAAAAELNCTTGTAQCLVAAEAAGQSVAARNRRDLQSTSVAIAAADVRFSTALQPTSDYLARSAGAPASARHAMCIARSTGLAPWFLGLIGVGNGSVSAQAVATQLPAGDGGFCVSVPVGVCPRTGGGSYVVGDWLAANATSSNGNKDAGLAAPKGSYSSTQVRGSFRWVQLSGAGNPGNGSDALARQLSGSISTCGVVTAGLSATGQGSKKDVRGAWNSRFGIYGGNGASYSATDAPPDRSGYAYPSKSPASPVIPVGTSAYADFRSRQAAFTRFQGSGSYAAGGTGNQTVSGTAITSAAHQAYGINRRLVTLPLLASCPGSGTSTTVTAMGCFLMLSPMANSSNGDVFLEYRGLANASGTPCQQGGAPGGPGGSGAMVATLVQ